MKRDRDEQTSEVAAKRKKISINQLCVCWYVVQLHMLNPNYKHVSIIAAKSDLGGLEINTHRKKSSLDVDMPHASSLCSLRSPSTYSAQTCFSPSPKFPPFRERSEVRDSDLPRGWVKDSPHPSPPWEIHCFPHFFILYTPESLILPWLTWQRAERAAYLVSDSISGCTNGSISVLQPAVWSHCVWKLSFETWLTALV